MSYDIVQKLREMTDKELFDTCIVNLVFKHKGSNCYSYSYSTFRINKNERK